MTKIITEATPEAAVDVRADTVTITERSELAFSAAVALVRQGWQISHKYPPRYFDSTGVATIMLTRAKPELEVNVLAAEIAEKAEALAAAKHRLAFDRDVQLAAEKIVADAQKAAAAAELAAKIAAQREALQALEAAAKATA